MTSSVRTITSVAFLACLFVLTTAKCNQLCTQEWNPVCAKNFNGQYHTFVNPCEFEVAQCENPAASWTRTRNGVCAQTRKDCPKICTAEWEPVCAKNTDGKFRTFGNPCEFDVAQCENPAASWTRTRNGVCAQTRKECPKVCTEEWKPVCAKNTDGKFHTFGNPCEFEVAQCMNPAASWTRTRNGVCAQTRKECAKVCTAEWKPVCAKNTGGKFHTFGNPCEFEVAQCMNPAASWTRTRNGVCAQTRNECAKVCTAEWKPVCAKNTDGKFHTFGNPCEFEVAQCKTPAASWTRTRNGVCAQTRKECPKTCTAEWRPVCAKNTDGKFHTFANPCEFEVAECLTPFAGWMITRDGVCAQTREECAKVCTAEWKPVCAKNLDGSYQTFGNTCKFEAARCLSPAAGWTTTRYGVCAQTRKECPKICSIELNPICAKNYKGEIQTFGNPCQLETAQCNNPLEGWFQTKIGEC